MSSFTSCFFFFNDTATTEIYTLSLHDALPISAAGGSGFPGSPPGRGGPRGPRSEEHTSELQSHHDLVCRLLLEKKKKKTLQLLNLIRRRHTLASHDLVNLPHELYPSPFRYVRV